MTPAEVATSSTLGALGAVWGLAVLLERWRGGPNDRAGQTSGKGFQRRLPDGTEAGREAGGSRQRGTGER